jgi:hypothetical protein
VKIYDLEKLSTLFGGEYVLGTKDLHSRACYLVYGALNPGEGDRLIRPGEGYEEILCVVAGSVVVHSLTGNFELNSGHAVHVKQDDQFFISNPSDTRAVYVIAGGPVRELQPLPT